MIIVKIKIVEKKVVPFVAKSLRQERISSCYSLMCKSYRFSGFESCIEFILLIVRRKKDLHM